jgi:hypothetical protein
MLAERAQSPSWCMACMGCAHAHGGSTSSRHTHRVRAARTRRRRRRRCAPPRTRAWAARCGRPRRSPGRSPRGARPAGGAAGACCCCCAPWATASGGAGAATTATGQEQQAQGQEARGRAPRGLVSARGARAAAGEAPLGPLRRHGGLPVWVRRAGLPQRRRHHALVALAAAAAAAAVRAAAAPAGPWAAERRRQRRHCRPSADTLPSSGAASARAPQPSQQGRASRACCIFDWARAYYGHAP